MEERSRPAASWRVGAGIFGLGIAGLVAHASRFHPFVADDALISLRYAKRLLQGQGLTWTDGAPVEGYSNLLWILLTALLGALGIELVTAARILGILCGVTAVGALAWRYRAPSPIEALPAAFGTATFVLAAPVAVWSIGGLEQPLVAATLAGAIAWLLPHLGEAAPPPRVTVAAGLCLAALCWTRPDGPLFTAVVCGMWVVFGHFRVGAIRGAASLAGLPILFVLAQLAFRIAYYGDYVPNTARVKLSPSWNHFVHGADYLWRGFLSLSPLSELVSLAAVLAFVPAMGTSRDVRRRIALLGALGCTWALYVAVVGGDIFPTFRHFVPLVIVLAFLTAETTRVWIARSGDSRRALTVVLLVGLVAFPFYLAGQWNHRQTRRAILERFEWEGQGVALALKQGFGAQQPRIAVTAAGTLPYWSELPALDMLGLNDRYLASHPPEDFGQGGLGHELGDADYVLGRAPDLVIFHTGLLRSQLPAGQQLQAHPEFQAAYTPVRFVGGDPVTPVFYAWVRRHGEKIGIRREGDALVVPGHLFNGNPGTLMRLDHEGFFAPVSHSQAAVVRELALEPGQWRIRVDAEGETGVTLRPAKGDGAAVEVLRPEEFGVAADADARVDLEVTVEPFQRAALRRVTLTRIGAWPPPIR